MKEERVSALTLKDSLYLKLNNRPTIKYLPPIRNVVSDTEMMNRNRSMKKIILRLWNNITELQNFQLPKSRARQNQEPDPTRWHFKKLPRSDPSSFGLCLSFSLPSLVFQIIDRIIDKATHFDFGYKKITCHDYPVSFWRVSMSQALFLPTKSLSTLSHCIHFSISAVLSLTMAV